MDNMVMAVIPRDEAEQVMSALIEAGHTSTVLETKGGVFRQSQSTVFIVVDDQNLETVCRIIEINCTMDMELNTDEMNREDSNHFPNTNKLGGAVVFVWKLHQINSY